MFISFVFICIYYIGSTYTCFRCVVEIHEFQQASLFTLPMWYTDYNRCRDEMDYAYMLTYITCLEAQLANFFYISSRVDVQQAQRSMNFLFSIKAQMHETFKKMDVQRCYQRWSHNLPVRGCPKTVELKTKIDQLFVR